jgi:hypothetical protein
MPFFTLCCYDYDSQIEIHYCHNDKNKTFDDFKKDCDYLIKKYGDEYLNKCKKYETPNVWDWINFISEKMNELDYEEIKFEKYKFYDKHYTFDVSNEEYNKEFYDIVGDKLFKKACNQYEMAMNYDEDEED